MPGTHSSILFQGIWHVTTNCQRLGGLQKHKFISHGSGGLEIQDQGAKWTGSGKSPSRLQIAGFSLRHHMVEEMNKLSVAFLLGH